MEEINQKKGNFFDSPVLKTKIKSANVKLPEIAFGYLDRTDRRTSGERHLHQFYE